MWHERVVLKPKMASLFLTEVFCVPLDTETNVSFARLELAQAEDCCADEDSGCENSLDQGDVMDFSTVAIAEHLTLLDAVHTSSLLHSSFHPSIKPLNLIRLNLSGFVHQSGAVPVSGLHVVTERQEGEHVAHYQGYHCAV